jgi:hypothetical protein
MTNSSERHLDGDPVEVSQNRGQQAPDMDKTLEFLELLMGQLQGALSSALVYLGDKLGLYKAMQGAGPLTAEELAERTGLHPRWIREWLRNQGADDLS